MSVTITLEDDEALVLFEALASGRLESTDAPERNSLWALEALLESALVAPISPDFRELVKAARESVLERAGK